MWIHDALVLVIDLVLLFKHEQTGLDLHKPRLNRHKQSEVLAELILLVKRKLIDALERLLVGEEYLKSHEDATVLVCVDVHPDFIPEVAQLGPDCEIVLVDLLGIAVIRPLGYGKDLLNLLTHLGVFLYALLPIESFLLDAGNAIN